MAKGARLRKVVASKQLTGEINVPGDKSISHRALILGSLAQGVSKIANLSPGKDCRSTVSCLKALGVKMKWEHTAALTVFIYGCGGSCLVEPTNVLNAGNSATTMRLLSGVLATQPFLSIVSGDFSLRSRPMKRVIQPLRLMGAEIYGRGGDSFAPLVIRGARLHGIEYKLPIPSAQVKSAILLAGLFAEGDTVIEQPLPSRDHTERLLELMGARVRFDSGRIHLAPLVSPLKAIDITVPGDISSAAYWIVAGIIHSNARIKIKGCGVNPLRTGILDALTAMGARIKFENQRLESNELVADLIVESSQLRGIEISGEIVPRLIDEIPLLALAGCVARGTTVIRNASELRTKESDRITATVRELSRLGARIDELPDGMVIHGGSLLTGAEVKSHGDHRLAMTLAVAGLVAKGVIVIHNAEVTEISYPGFWQELENISMSSE